MQTQNVATLTGDIKRENAKIARAIEHYILSYLNKNQVINVDCFKRCIYEISSWLSFTQLEIIKSIDKLILEQQGKSTTLKQVFGLR